MSRYITALMLLTVLLTGCFGGYEIAFEDGSVWRLED